MDELDSEIDLDQEPFQEPENEQDIESDYKPENSVETNDFEVNDEEYQMSQTPKKAEDYQPSDGDVEDVGLIFDDKAIDSLKQFSKDNEISTGLFQKLIGFQVKLIRDDVDSDDIALERFKKFAKSERMNVNLFDAIVKFQKNYAKQYQKSIKQINQRSIKVNGRPNPNAHQIHLLSRSKAYLNKRDKGHKLAIKKMVQICGR